MADFFRATFATRGRRHSHQKPLLGAILRSANWSLGGNINDDVDVNGNVNDINDVNGNVNDVNDIIYSSNNDNVNDDINDVSSKRWKMAFQAIKEKAEIRKWHCHLPEKGRTGNNKEDYKGVVKTVARVLAFKPNSPGSIPGFPKKIS